MPPWASFLDPGGLRAASCACLAWETQICTSPGLWRAAVLAEEPEIGERVSLADEARLKSEEAELRAELRSAREALQRSRGPSRAAMVELRRFRSPAPLLVRLLKAALALSGRRAPSKWLAVQKQLSDVDHVLRALEALRWGAVVTRDPLVFPRRAVQRILHLVSDPAMRPDALRVVSRSSATLCALVLGLSALLAAQQRARGITAFWRNVATRDAADLLLPRVDLPPTPSPLRKEGKAPSRRRELSHRSPRAPRAVGTPRRAAWEPGMDVDSDYDSAPEVVVATPKRRPFAATTPVRPAAQPARPSAPAVAPAAAATGAPLRPAQPRSATEPSPAHRHVVVSPAAAPPAREAAPAPPPPAPAGPPPEVAETLQILRETQRALADAEAAAARRMREAAAQWQSREAELRAALERAIGVAQASQAAQRAAEERAVTAVSEAHRRAAEAAELRERLAHAR